MSRRMHVMTTDVVGRLRPVWLGFSNSILALSALQAMEALMAAGVTGGGESASEVIGLGTVPVGPSAGDFPSAYDYVSILFACANGPYNLQLAGPKHSLFEADGVTLDLQNATVINFETAAIASLRSAWDEPLEGILKGQRGWSRFWDQYMAVGNINLLNLQLPLAIPFGSWMVDVEDQNAIRVTNVLWTRNNGQYLLDNVLAEVQAMTNCRIVHQEKTASGFDAAHRTSPVAGTYDGRDLLRIRLSTVAADVVDIQMPAPLSSILAANTWDLNLANALVLAFETAAIAGLVQWIPGASSPAARAITGILQGIREPRQEWPTTRRTIDATS